MNDDGTHIGGITGFFNSLCFAIRQITPTRCVMIFDGKGGSQRRRQLFEDYKANRRGLRVRLNRAYDFEDADEEHKNAMRQLLRISDYLETLPITVLIHDNVEADDVIAYLATEVFDEKVVIMFTDGDFVQLVNERISVWNPPRKKLYTPTLVKDDYEFTPNNYVYLRILSGDKSDNIPGVRGIGIKTVQKHLPIITGDDDISFDVFKDFLKNNVDNPIIKKLFDNIDIIERNYQLMKLGEININGTTKSHIREQISSPVSSTNTNKFKQLFLVDKLYSAIPNLNSWLSLNFLKLNEFSKKTGE